MAYSHHLSDEHDQRYTCTNEDCKRSARHALKLDTHVDVATWTCNACDEAVLIKLLDHEGKAQRVYRIQAQDLEPGDRISQSNDLCDWRTVYDSKPSTRSKPNEWCLALEHVGKWFVKTDCFFYRVAD